MKMIDSVQALAVATAKNFSAKDDDAAWNNEIRDAVITNLRVVADKILDVAHKAEGSTTVNLAAMDVLMNTQQLHAYFIEKEAE